MDDYSEKRLDRIEAKIDALTEAVNTMRINAAGCAAHFEEHDRQLESIEVSQEKKETSEKNKIDELDERVKKMELSWAKVMGIAIAAGFIFELISLFIDKMFKGV
jgi:folate-dependent phosphoribosylglycinamide formyltransferase PurN